MAFCSAFSQGTCRRIQISKDIELVKLSDNVYVHVSYADMGRFGRVASNGMVITSGNEAFLFDTPTTDAATKVLVSYLKDSLKLRVVGFVPNHWHSDCMGGLRYLTSMGIESYACEKTISIAKAKHLPVPKHGFMDSLLLKLGSKPVKCYYLGAAHSLDNIVVWMPSENILFAGCMVKGLSYTDLGNTEDGDVKAYPKMIKRVMDKFPNVKLVVPGHGAWGGVELLKHTYELAIGANSKKR
ncbi:subclass B1 metallo-beta-lactamase [uncultured Acetobacteroides sp.]|uniref:subclass B1 metallo-beta-lactamase n=1 Tax=uncultured Acetobacteroides sp. TaxID=1760811 RepID=UPI003749F32B